MLVIGVASETHHMSGVYLSARREATVADDCVAEEEPQIQTLPDSVCVCVCPLVLIIGRNGGTCAPLASGRSSFTLRK